MNDQVGLLVFGITFTVVLYGSYWIYLKTKLSKLQAAKAARKAK